MGLSISNHQRRELELRRVLLPYPVTSPKQAKDLFFQVLEGEFPHLKAFLSLQVAEGIAHDFFFFMRKLRDYSQDIINPKIVLLDEALTIFFNHEHPESPHIGISCRELPEAHEQVNLPNYNERMLMLTPVFEQVFIAVLRAMTHLLKLVYERLGTQSERSEDLSFLSSLGCKNETIRGFREWYEKDQGVPLRKLDQLSDRILEKVKDCLSTICIPESSLQAVRNRISTLLTNAIFGLRSEFVFLNDNGTRDVIDPPATLSDAETIPSQVIDIIPYILGFLALIDGGKHWSSFQDDEGTAKLP